jgi:hypothetical protein
MFAALSHTDDFLRGANRFHPNRWADCPTLWLILLILGFAPIYGGMMGSYHLHAAERLWQVLYAALKVPLLLFATTLLCLPGFFVLNTIMGLRDDLRESFRAILAGQAGLSIALASLSPITRFWYFSSSSYRGALLFNAFIFTVATIAGHVVMFRYYRGLIRRNHHHRTMWYGWLILYAFVGIQMGWIARPFVGTPNMAVSFFREGAFSNAYVVVARLIFGSS